MRTILEGKLAGETVIVPISFLSRLPVGESLNTASTAATTYSGTDPSPSSVVVSSTISGANVDVKLTGGVLGVTYLLVCSATTSAGQTLQLSAYLVIVPNQT